MKDILFLIPLYYQASSVKRFKAYLEEDKGNFTYDVFVCCTNKGISSLASEYCNEVGFKFAFRENIGGGEGSLWFLQNHSGLKLEHYKYIWYFEESCEPISKKWITDLVSYMDGGASLVGWDWHPKAKQRPNSIPHVIQGINHSCVAYENTDKTPKDINGQSMDKIWDTPGYRHETLVFRSEDFVSFKYPDPRDPIWFAKSGWRSYGTRAERMWWDLSHSNIHGIYLPSPNLQWNVISSKKFVPPVENLFFPYFRELTHAEKTDEKYLIPISRFRRKVKLYGHLYKAKLKHSLERMIKKILWKK